MDDSHKEDVQKEVTFIKLRLDNVECVQAAEPGMISYIKTVQKLIMRKDRIRFIVELIAKHAMLNKKILVLLFTINFYDTLKTEINTFRVPCRHAQVLFILAWKKSFKDDSDLHILPYEMVLKITKYMTEPLARDSIEMSDYMTYKNIPNDRFDLVISTCPTPNRIISHESVIEIADNNGLFKRQAKSRKNRYLDLGYKINRIIKIPAKR